MFGTCHHLIEIFRLGGALEGGLAFLLIHPKDGVIAIRINCLCAVSLLFEKGKRMNYGKKLTNIICAVDGSEMEYLCTGGKVDTLVFHRSGITRASRIHSPPVCRHLHRQRQHCIMTIIRRVLHNS